jgi:hypothetical protein
MVLDVLFKVVFFFLDLLHLFGLGAGNQMWGELKISSIQQYNTVTTRSLNRELEE